MTTIISDEAVNIALNTWLGGVPAWRNNATERLRTEMRAALTAALPFLPVQVAVKKLEWGELRYTEDYSFAQDAETSIGRYIATDNGWFLQGQYGWKSEDDIEAAKAAAQADYEARILSALEPSVARELALEKGYRRGVEAAAKLIECGCKSLLHGKGECQFPGNCSLEDAAAIRSLISTGGDDE